MVKIAPTAKPPVCKIIDYGKYRYELARKEKEARKKQKVVELKEVRLSPNIDSNDLDDILDGKFENKHWDQENDSVNDIFLYYFGNDLDGDGSMKTGNVTINLDGNSYNFLFKKSGNPASGRGRGVTGIEDNKYIYSYGCRIKASSDDKYRLVSVFANGEKYDVDNVDINSSDVQVTKLSAPKWDKDNTYTNIDEETVRYHYGKVSDDKEGIDFNFKLGDDKIENHTNGYYLVNTSGNIQKKKI